MIFGYLAVTASQSSGGEIVEGCTTYEIGASMLEPEVSARFREIKYR